MKKYLIIFLSFILVIVVIWLLQVYGVISLRSWGEKLITSTPFLKEYVQTNQAYQGLADDRLHLQEEKSRLASENQLMTRELKKLNEQVHLQQAKIEELTQELAIAQEQNRDEQERLDKLVKIYSEMEAADVANIIPALEKELALTLLQNLKEEKTAAILTNISPEEAAEFSRALSVD